MSWFSRDERILDQALQWIRENPLPDGKLPSFPNLPPSVLDLLKLAVDLNRTSATASPRLEFAPEAEKRLLRSLSAKSIETPAAVYGRRAPLRRPGRGFAAAMLAILLAIFSGWGTLTASAAALPGDALYPVKIGSERVQLGLTLSPVENLRLLIQFSDKRIGEIQNLTRLGRSNGIPQALADYEETIRLIERGTEQLPSNGSGLLLEFRQSLSRQRQVLSELRGKLSPGSQSALDTALSEIDHGRRILQKKRSDPGANQSARLHGRDPQTLHTPHNNQPTKIKTPRETKNPNSQDNGPEKTPKPKK